MKADDYVLKFAEYLNDPRSVWKDVPNDAVIENPEFDATIGICFDLMKEIKELVIKRNAQSGHAIAAVVIVGAILVAFLVKTFLVQAFEIPFWVVLAAHAAIGLGTLAGGWRIIHTMGSKITKLQPVGGFAAETGAAIALMTATLTGVPVSTTHAITGAIVGVGSTRRLSAVRWGVAGQIIWAWVLTIPAAFTIGAVSYLTLHMLGAN